MKDLFEGLKRAKTRAALSAVTALLFTAFVCVGAYALMPKMIFFPIVAVVLGCVLLFLINFLNSKKRKAEFASIINNGVTVKAVKKQLIAEVLVIVVIFGLAGCSIGVASAKPFSSKLISLQRGEVLTPPTTDENGETSEDDNGFFAGGFDKDNLPDEFDMDNMPEGFDPSDMPQQGQPPQMPNGEEFNGDFSSFDRNNLPSDFDESNLPEGFDKDSLPERENMTPPTDRMKGGVTSSIIAGAAAVILFSISSITGVALPIKKEN